MYQLLKNSTSIQRVTDGAFIPADPANADYAAYLAWLAEGNTPEPAPVESPTPQYERALDNMLDTEAQSRRYTDRFTCALRAGYPGPYQVEGIAFAQWMDGCNQQAYNLMTEVMQGKTSMPTIDEFLAMFPKMKWPD